MVITHSDMNYYKYSDYNSPISRQGVNCNLDLYREYGRFLPVLRMIMKIVPARWPVGLF